MKVKAGVVLAKEIEVEVDDKYAILNDKKAYGELPRGESWRMEQNLVKDVNNYLIENNIDYSVLQAVWSADGTFPYIEYFKED